VYWQLRHSWSCRRVTQAATVANPEDPEFCPHSTGDQAFVININGFNRPTNVRFGPDGCAYVMDYGAVRDLGADSHFVGPPANSPVVQIPGTGVVWKICPSQ
jgi:hypothetical protein